MERGAGRSLQLGVGAKLIVLAELFELNVQSIEFDLVAQRRTEGETGLAANESAEQVGLEIVKRQNVRRFRERSQGVLASG